MNELECCIDRTDVVFKLATSRSVHYFFQAISGFKNIRTVITSLDEIDVIFKLATLDKLDNVSNLGQPILV